MTSYGYTGGGSMGVDATSNSVGNDAYLTNNFTVREGTYRNVFEYVKPSSHHNHHGHHHYQQQQQQQQYQLQNAHHSLGGNFNNGGGGAAGSGGGGTSAGLPPSSQSSSIPVRISVVVLKEEDDTNTDAVAAAGEERFPIRLMYNVGREISVHIFRSVWAAPDIARPLDRQVFKGPPTCHDLNSYTASQPQQQSSTASSAAAAPAALHMLIGFYSGCTLYCDPKRENSRFFNEDRAADNTKVACVKWLPGTDNMFITAHVSGNVFVHNTQLPSMPTGTQPVYSEIRRGHSYSIHVCNKGNSNSRNPIAKWQFDGGINDVAFSPGGKYIAFARRDGLLQVFVYSTYELIGASRSYFGGLLCCAWSHDSKFVAAAGEDDLVHVWSFEHCRLIARCRGHRSWVSRVAWDPWNSYNNTIDSSTNDDSNNYFDNNNMPITAKPKYVEQRRTAASRQISDSFCYDDGRAGGQPPARMVYRFASVGQDTQLCVWELTEDVLNQVLFPSKARNSFVIPVDSELLKRGGGGRRLAFRAAAAAAKQSAAAVGGGDGPSDDTVKNGSGSSSLASSTRSSNNNNAVPSAFASERGSGDHHKASNESVEPVVITNPQTATGRKFRFPLGFMRRSTAAEPPSSASKKAAKNAAAKHDDEIVRENDSNSTLTAAHGKSVGGGISNDAVTSTSTTSAVVVFKQEQKSPPAQEGNDNVGKRGTRGVPVTRSASAYEPPRRASAAALRNAVLPLRQTHDDAAEADNNNNNDADDAGNVSDDGPVEVQLMSENEALHNAEQKRNKSSHHHRTNGGARSVDLTSSTTTSGLTSPTSTIVSTATTTTTTTTNSSNKKKKRRQFSLLRLTGRGSNAGDATNNNMTTPAKTAAENQSQKLSNGASAAAVGSTTSRRRIGRRVAAHLFSSSSSSNNNSNNQTNSKTSDQISSAENNAFYNQLGTPECPRLDDIPMLEPVMCKSIGNERLTDIVFLDECMLIAMQDGVIQVWGRPEYLQAAGHEKRSGSITSTTRQRVTVNNNNNDADNAATTRQSGVAASKAAGVKHNAKNPNTSNTTTKLAHAAPMARNKYENDATADGARAGDDFVEEARYGQQVSQQLSYSPAPARRTLMQNGSSSSKNRHTDAAVENDANTNADENDENEEDDDDDDELINIDTQQRASGGAPPPSSSALHKRAQLSFGEKNEEAAAAENGNDAVPKQSFSTTKNVANAVLSNSRDSEATLTSSRQNLPSNATPNKAKSAKQTINGFSAPDRQQQQHLVGKNQSQFDNDGEEDDEANTTKGLKNATKTRNFGSGGPAAAAGQSTATTTKKLQSFGSGTGGIPVEAKSAPGGYPTSSTYSTAGGASRSSGGNDTSARKATAATTNRQRL